MTDTRPPEHTSAPAPLRPAHPVRRTAARAARAGVSVIWAVPIIALLVTLALAWNAYAGRGTLVSVGFKDATGITPGETLLKFREITVGQVEAVRFTHDLEQVIVDMRVDKDIAQFIDDDAEFWIVRPQVSAQGISRLDTVLTGAFIEGWWDSEPGTTELEVHRGLERAPLTRSNERGTWVRLSATDAAGMSEGAPILYHGLAVGQMQNLRLSESGETVVADVFIEAPHDRRLTTTTVFWDVSGFGISLGPQGIALNIGSLASVVQGGAEFATLSSGGAPIAAGHVFHLQPDRETAQNSLFATSPENELRLTMLVPEAVRGLPVGADVQFQGLTVGRITNLSVRVSPDDGDVFQDITLAVSPQRMGLSEDAGPAEALEFLTPLVEDGLRARIAGAGLFGTSLMVELVEIPGASPAQIDAAAEPFPVIPAAPPDLSDVSATAQGLMTRLGRLKLEELLKSATDMMDSVTAIAASQDTRAIPESLRRAADEIGTAATDIGAVAAELRDSGLGPRIAQAVDDTSAAAKAVTEA
ncbi:MAG TPA: MCE family protein, partial [Paracoccus sp.]|nr:MCE family protein [Paracoccus sp. (in: a-proteobacteria)]